jgi:GR25 family glycosyltransferase involved in LPS biosynthesis
VYRVFCIHHTDERARKRRLTTRFRQLGMEIQWIETYRPRDMKAWDHEGLSANSVGETSCALKHRDALRRQVAEGIELAVILEDDVDLPDGFDEDLARYLSEFTAIGGDVLMIGTCYDMHVERLEAGRSVYVAPVRLGRCTHAYAVTLAAARVIVPELDHMPKGIGHDLNDIIERHQLTMCWVEPGLRQLTMAGEMLSAIGERRTWEDRKRVAKWRAQRLVSRVWPGARKA